MKLTLRYEIKPYIVNQEWGIYNPIYEQFGFSRHNGVDLRLAPDGLIHAPFAFQTYRTLWQPQGGGNVITILSQDSYEAPDGKPAQVLIDYMHLKKTLKKQGEHGALGDAIAIGNNTGFSTGPHCHTQYRWVRRKGGHLIDVEKNEANNSFDPTPYYNGLYARDTQIIPKASEEIAKFADELQAKGNTVAAKQMRAIVLFLRAFGY